MLPHGAVATPRLIFDAERGNVCLVRVYLGYCENMGKFAILLAFLHITLGRGKEEGLQSRVLTFDLCTDPHWGIKVHRYSAKLSYNHIATSKSALTELTKNLSPRVSLTQTNRLMFTVHVCSQRL